MDHDQYFSDAAYESKAPRPKHGCLFYGCLIAIIAAVIGAVVVGVVGYVAYRSVLKWVDQYADDAPQPLPPVEMSAERRDEVKARFDAFREALDRGEEVEPLVLTSDEINALLERKEDLRGRVRVDLEGDTVKGRVSIPLEGIGLAPLKGRYINGEGTFRVELNGDRLEVRVEELKVRGKPLPDEFMAEIRGKNLVEDDDFEDDDDFKRQVRKLRSVEVKDSTLIITPRPADERRPDAEKAKTAGGGDAEQQKADEPAADPKPEEPRAAEPAAEPKAEEPGAEPKAESAAEPKAEEPAAEPKAEPAAEPKAEAPKLAGMDPGSAARPGDACAA